MLCLDQLAQLRDFESKFTAIPADLLIIGSGSVQQAAETRTRLKVPFTFLADPERVSFQAAKMRKDWGSTLNLRTIPAIFRALGHGHFQRKTQGAPFQQGGAMAIATDGSIIFEHINRFGGDHVDPEAILVALKAAT